MRRMLETHRGGWGAAFVAVALTLASSSASAIDAPRYLGPKPPKQVKRVVTLVPSATEIVLALGAGETLVGVSRFDEMPEVKTLPRVGGFLDPSIEAVLALKPDLFILQPGPGNERPAHKLAELGVPVLAVPLHSTEQTLQAIREVGKALGRTERADELVRGIEATRTRIRDRAKTLKRPRVLLVYEWEPLIVAGPGAFADDLLRDAGAVNAAEKTTTPYPNLPVEGAIGARPDVIIDATHNPERGARMRRLPGLSDARWVRMPSQDLMHPGPSLGRALEDIFKLIHPDDGTKPGK